MEIDYKLGAQRMQEIIYLNDRFIYKSIERLNNQPGYVETKQLEAEIKSRRRHIEDVNNHYNKLLKVYQWDPEILELLSEGWNKKIKRI